MVDTIRLGNIVIAVSRKDIKHVHLSVHPPNGRVTLAAPSGTRLDVARAYAITRLGWIRRQREQLSLQSGVKLRGDSLSARVTMCGAAGTCFLSLRGMPNRL